MKINSVGQNDAINRYTDRKKVSTEKPAPVVNITDKVELSEGAQKYSELLKAAKGEMDKLDSKDEQKTADIINRIKDGSYKVDDNDIITSIMKGYSD